VQLQKNKTVKNKLRYNSQEGYKYFNVLPKIAYFKKKKCAIICRRCKIWKIDIQCIDESEKLSESILF